jgi:hypothetical protein
MKSPDWPGLDELFVVRVISRARCGRLYISPDQVGMSSRPLRSGITIGRGSGCDQFGRGNGKHSKRDAD